MSFLKYWWGSLYILISQNTKIQVKKKEKRKITPFPLNPKEQSKKTISLCFVFWKFDIKIMFGSQEIREKI